MEEEGTVSFSSVTLPSPSATGLTVSFSEDLTSALGHLIHVALAVLLIVTGLLSLNVGVRVGHRGGDLGVVGILVCTAVAEQDVAVITGRVGKGRIANGSGHTTSRIALHKADRSGKFLPLAGITTIIERTVAHIDSDCTGSLVIDVHRRRRAGKAAIFDVDLAVSVGVHCRFRGEEVAAGQGNIILTGSPADVNTLDIFLALNGLPVAVGQIDRHGMVGVPLPPHAEIIKVVGRDRDILGKEFTVSGLRTALRLNLKVSTSRSHSPPEIYAPLP